MPEGCSSLPLILDEFSHVASRRVQIVGSTPHPDDLFMRQVGRTLTAADGGVLVGQRVLICDRDAKWSASVRAGLSEAGIRVVQTFQAPNPNAYAELFVRSIKQECLDRVIPFGEQHLRRTIAEFVEHYHSERNHQALGNELIDGAPTVERRLAEFTGVSVWTGSSITTCVRRDPPGRVWWLGSRVDITGSAD